jgi:5-methylcytosine-specific restriction protein A
LGYKSAVALPKLTVDAVHQAMNEYDRLGPDAFLRKYGFGRAKTYFLVHGGRSYDSKAIAGVAHGYAVPSEGPLSNKRFSGGETAAAKWLRDAGFEVVRRSAPPESGSPRGSLALTLHAPTSRKDAYALFGIDYDQRQRYLNKGLSPRLSDGGYFVWITLDKSGLDEAYDYEDQLFPGSLEWVTQRGAEEDDADYVALREPATRVSLFVRHRDRDAFTYLGEMRYDSHQQFTDADDRPQMRYAFQLDNEVPDTLLAQLYGGQPTSRPPNRQAAAATSIATKPRTRRPTTFGQTRQAFAYAVGATSRTVVPAHHNYQVLLQQFLTAKGIQAEWERDFVDVRFTLNGVDFIGEIKVTSYLTLDEAFRTALGQLLFYGHMQFAGMPGLIMLLDRAPDAKPSGISLKLKRVDRCRVARGRVRAAESSGGTGADHRLSDNGRVRRVITFEVNNLRRTRRS